jgi:hypothetical protein
MRQDYDKVMFYVKELFSTFNYLTTYTIMKAKLVPADDDLKEVSTEVKAEPLLKTDEIAHRFTDFGGKIDTYKQYATDLKVTDPDTLMVAENTSSEILEVSKSVEKVRKTFKEPYFLTGKSIDEYAKLLSEPLEKARKDINAIVGNYKTVQAAFAKEKADKEQQALDQVEKDKMEEIDKIARIEQQLNARLYGGYWINKQGLRQTSAGCVNVDQCQELIKMIDEKVPKADSYIYYGERHEEMLKGLKKRIAEHMINVNKLSSGKKDSIEEAMGKIQSAKVSADVKVIETKEKGEYLVAKEVKKESKAIISVVQEARKGLKRILKFVVVEHDKVGKEFLKVDDEKVRFYMNEHNEEIKEKLLKNEEILPGIKFYIDEDYASQ